LNIARRRANIAENAKRFLCVIPQTRRIVLRRGKWISQKYRSIFALDVRTKLDPFGLSPYALAMIKSGD
jgi:hypothetical protein